jgi:hypothetical protein
MCRIQRYGLAVGALVKHVGGGRILAGQRQDGVVAHDAPRRIVVAGRVMQQVDCHALSEAVAGASVLGLCCKSCCGSCTSVQTRSRRGQRHQPGVGGARPGLGRMARPHHDTGRRPTAARPTPSTPRSTPQAPTVTRSSICGPGGSRLRHGVARHDAGPPDPATARLRARPYAAVSGLTSIGHEHSWRV